jgi:hypothetical protein
LPERAVAAVNCLDRMLYGSLNDEPYDDGGVSRKLE